MRLFFDECVNRRLARDLPGHEVATARQMGWAGVKNGKLLTLVAAEFDAFITVDRGIAYQQKSETLPLPVFILKGRTNRLDELRRLAPQLLRLLEAPLVKQSALLE